jgi:hypothetical protein
MANRNAPDPVGASVGATLDEDADATEDAGTLDDETGAAVGDAGAHATKIASAITIKTKYRLRLSMIFPSCYKIASANIAPVACIGKREKQNELGQLVC